MNEEDERPVPTAIALDRLGVAELERYIAALRAEIERAEGYIAAKQSQRGAADDLFKF